MKTTPHTKPLLIALLLATVLATIWLFNTPPQQQGQPGSKAASINDSSSITTAIQPQAPKPSLKQSLPQQAQSQSQKPQPSSPPPIPEQLSRTLDNFFATLPSQEQASALRAQRPHSTPIELVLSAQQLGAIMDLESTYPEQKAAFIAFYKECSQNVDSDFTIRALCVRSFMKKSDSQADKEALLSTLSPAVMKAYKIADKNDITKDPRWKAE